MTELSTLFLLTHLSRGATVVSVFLIPWIKFLLTHLSRGATIAYHSILITSSISTHAPLARCGMETECLYLWILNFYSRTSREVRRYRHCTAPWLSVISTHAPLARCDPASVGLTAFLFISTHAPLARCDILSQASENGISNFYSRTSREVRPSPVF